MFRPVPRVLTSLKEGFRKGCCSVAGDKGTVRVSVANTSQKGAEPPSVLGLILDTNVLQMKLLQRTRLVGYCPTVRFKGDYPVGV